MASTTNQAHAGSASTTILPFRHALGRIMATRIITTGGHSGLGFEALKTLLASPALRTPCSLTLLVRDPTASRVVQARDRLVAQYRTASRASCTLDLQIKPLDLASLSSVRQAASALQHQLADSAEGTDILLLNAAVAKSSRETVVDTDKVSSTVEYPTDGMVDANGRVEETACVNHVAHLVLVSMLAPTIAKNARNGRHTRIVFTGSALHRSLKDIADLDSFFAASSTGETKAWTLRETYAASKFLQMLGVRALRRRLEEDFEKRRVPRGRVEVVVVQPGFVPQTQLCRESGLMTRLAMSYILPWAPFATSLEDAGTYIANACTIDLAPPQTEEQADGFHSSTGAVVQSALLEVHAKGQRFGTLDARTADVQLQDKWWPAACDAS